MKKEVKRKLPEGWSCKEFPKCLIKESVKTEKIPETHYLKEGKYPIVDQGSNFIAGYTNDESLVYKHQFPVIVFGDHTRTFKYVDFNFAIGADGTKIIHSNTPSINPRYFYFALKASSFPNDGYNRHYKYLQKLEIPFPPTEREQIEISQELERKMAEIEKMRQAALKQKDAIFAMQGAILRGVFPFKDGDKLPQGWKWASLWDTSLVTLIMGQSPPSETYNKERKGLPFFQGCTDFGRIHPEPSVWCSDPNRIAEPNDILMSVRAPVGPTNIAKEKCCIGRGIAAIRCKERLSFKYLIWVLRKFEREICSEGVGSVFGAVGKDELKAIRFPIPLDIKEQINLANKLDEKINNLEKMNDAINKKLEAIELLQSAVLREVFDFQEVNN